MPMPPRPATASIRQPAMCTPSSTSVIASMVTRMDLRAAILADRDRIRADLERLVRIPSIAFSDHPGEPLDAAAALVAELLGDGARFVEVRGEAPSVLAE